MLAFLTLLSLEKTECDVIISISILNIEKTPILVNIALVSDRTGIGTPLMKLYNRSDQSRYTDGLKSKQSSTQVSTFHSFNLAGNVMTSPNKAVCHSVHVVMKFPTQSSERK